MNKGQSQRCRYERERGGSPFKDVWEYQNKAGQFFFFLHLFCLTIIEAVAQDGGIL